MSMLRLDISCATWFTLSCRLSQPTMIMILTRSDEVSSTRQMRNLW